MFFSCGTEYTKTSFAALTVILLLAAILALLVNAGLLIRLRRANYLPENIRLLLGNLTLGILLGVGLFFEQAILNLFAVFRGHFSPIHPSYCLIRQTITALFHSLVSISILGIGLERWYAAKAVSRIAARATAWLESPKSKR